MKDQQVYVSLDMLRRSVISPLAYHAPLSRSEAWIWLLDSGLDDAPHSPRGVVFARWHTIADGLGWSIKRVRTFLKFLEGAGLIKADAPQRGCVKITLLNLDSYTLSGALNE